MDFEVIPVSLDSLEWQCSVLKIGGATVLLNCGWTEALDPKVFAPVIPYLGDLDLIVLTHADFRHLGALPYLLSRHLVACPVVCTEPVCRLGELACVASVEDREKYKAPADEIEVDDVLRTFMSRLTPLSYRENFLVQPRGGKSLSVSAHMAGGHLGSAYWTMQCGGISAVYLVDADLRRGRYLDGFELQHLLPPRRGAALRWDVMITAPLPAINAHLPHRGAHQAPQEVYVASRSLTVAKHMHEQVLLEETIGALRRGGSVLIPADVVGQTLEVLLLLEEAWAQDRQLSANYPLVWLSSTGDMILDQVKTRLEYMSKEVLRNFEKRYGHHPFVLRNLQIFQTLDELDAAYPVSRPKVILSTSPHLTCGDSRELLIRLAPDPRTLLWIVGVPPAGTLARQLLDDFVVRHATRKDYRIQQHFKQALPDEQLSQYYEAKLEELAESGLRWPSTLPPELNPRVFDELPEEDKELYDVSVDVNGDSQGDLKFEFGEEVVAPKVKGILSRAQALRDLKAGSGALWTPVGWPGSRTAAHREARGEGDEYGHMLMSSELREWRAQDQEGNKYSNPAGPKPDSAGSVDEVDAVRTKEEVLKVDDESAARELFLDYRDALRVHFREPMHYESRERTVRVACAVRFLPDRSQEPQDLYTVVRDIAPRHVVLLPTASLDASSRPDLAKQLRYARMPPGSRVPQVHHLEPGGSPLRLKLRSLKRRIQFTPDVWQKVKFLKTSDGIKVARVRASPAPTPHGVEQRVLELECSGASTETAASLRLPREGALFVGRGREPVQLSGLKASMQAASWGSTVADFNPPGAHVTRPWSSRILVADGSVALGWIGGQSAITGGAALPGGDEIGSSGAGSNGGRTSGTAVLRIEGVPGEQFFKARAALYKTCALV
eukprot:TRINITY_DN75459_c0_g1_i1.p1 TRINITY_DN75459_c0_g1~~TRINITY_DN75459_c0_g1_i1.p1  ORF type:complete len:894 (-),score=131.09 TRINITY_DN75459_c0_g1_i1:102-2783(-)